MDGRAAPTAVFRPTYDIRARMVVSAVYEPPQKKLTVLSEDGSKLLLDCVLRKIVAREAESNDRENVAKTELPPDNYEFALLGMEEAGGDQCYAFHVKPRRRDKFLCEGKVWIHARDFAVVWRHP